MPPKRKAPNSPRPLDPLAHLTQAQRKALSMQARRAVPRAKQQTASTEDSLPDVAGLVSAVSKQDVHLVEEGGVEDEMEVDRSGCEDKGESEDEGEGKLEGDGGEGKEDPALGKSNKHKGRLPGSSGYTVELEQRLVKAVRTYLPRTEVGWRKVATQFNSRAPKHHQRSWESLKSKYGRMIKQRKPTGDGKGSAIHDAVLEIEGLRAAQEETVTLEDDPWPESDAPTSGRPQGSFKKAHVKSKPTPARVPAPAPFARSKGNQPKLHPKVLEDEIIELSSDSDVVIIPQTPPKRKTNRSSVTYHAEKVPEATAVKGPPSKRHKTAQKTAESLMTILEHSQSQNGSSDAAGIAKVQLFGRDRTIERISTEVATVTEKCHQLERQIDGVAMVMTMYGIPVPPAAAEGNAGPALAISLAGFLQTRAPPTASAAAVLAASVTAPTTAPTTARATAIASSTPLKGDEAAALISLGSHNDLPNQLGDPAFYEYTEQVPSASAGASGSNLSVAEKDKLPIYLGE
ncbi:hypothetical protein RSOL_181260 [Rhizoctonia solani AG-3 Rhs1AP]|uniref:Myb-like domain-containing protein n=1 Tax=Rhizoctonia solani AG-3 Rhs1AP TaxID=1086054 RepID=X8J4P2_9AGAM|nr:hypothetical protein RSOL_181260 [Rhizoctonia solani AG-3 Rhs1AP]